jgi:hypothetical protein
MMIFRENSQLTKFRLAWRQKLAVGNTNTGG